jgi:LysM repeat protein
VTSYRVQETDSLLSIAKLYKISPAELRDFNRLPSDKLPTAGKTLLVPTPAIVSL